MSGVVDVSGREYQTGRLEMRVRINNKLRRVDMSTYWISCIHRRQVPEALYYIMRYNETQTRSEARTRRVKRVKTAIMMS